MRRSVVFFATVLCVVLFVAVTATGQGVLGKRYVAVGYDIYEEDPGYGLSAVANLPLAHSLDLSAACSFLPGEELTQYSNGRGVRRRDDTWIVGAGVTVHSSVDAQVASFFSTSAAGSFRGDSGRFSAAVAAGLEIDVYGSIAARPHIGFAAMWYKDYPPVNFLDLGLDLDVWVAERVFLSLGAVYVHLLDDSVGDPDEVSASFGIGVQL